MDPCEIGNSLQGLTCVRDRKGLPFHIPVRLIVTRNRCPGLVGFQNLSPGTKHWYKQQQQVPNQLPGAMCSSADYACDLCNVELQLCYFGSSCSLWARGTQRNNNDQNLFKPS